MNRFAKFGRLYLSVLLHLSENLLRIFTKIQYKFIGLNPGASCNLQTRLTKSARLGKSMHGSELLQISRRLVPNVESGILKCESIESREFRIFFPTPYYVLRTA